jgi:hypothetical protein
MQKKKNFFLQRNNILRNINFKVGQLTFIYNATKKKRVILNYHQSYL